jgi:hypothetical protein
MQRNTRKLIKFDIKQCAVEKQDVNGKKNTNL